jgi:Mg2+ and Co2+ transporter CorA
MSTREYTNNLDQISESDFEILAYQKEALMNEVFKYDFYTYHSLRKSSKRSNKLFVISTKRQTTIHYSLIKIVPISLFLNHIKGRNKGRQYITDIHNNIDLPYILRIKQISIGDLDIPHINQDKLLFINSEKNLYTYKGKNDVGGRQKHTMMRVSDGIIMPLSVNTVRLALLEKKNYMFLYYDSPSNVLFLFGGRVNNSFNSILWNLQEQKRIQQQKEAHAITKTHAFNIRSEEHLSHRLGTQQTRIKTQIEFTERQNREERRIADKKLSQQLAEALARNRNKIFTHKNEQNRILLIKKKALNDVLQRQSAQIDAHLISKIKKEYNEMFQLIATTNSAFNAELFAMEQQDKTYEQQIVHKEQEMKAKQALVTQYGIELKQISSDYKILKEVRETKLADVQRRNTQVTQQIDAIESELQQIKQNRESNVNEIIASKEKITEYNSQINTISANMIARIKSTTQNIDQETATFKTAIKTAGNPLKSTTKGGSYSYLNKRKKKSSRKPTKKKSSRKPTKKKSSRKPTKKKSSRKPTKKKSSRKPPKKKSSRKPPKKH